MNIEWNESILENRILNERLAVSIIMHFACDFSKCPVDVVGDPGIVMSILLRFNLQAKHAAIGN
jgi:hypothetical protein